VADVQTPEGVALSLAPVLQAAGAGIDPIMDGMLTTLGAMPPDTRIGNLTLEAAWLASRPGYDDRLNVDAAATKGVLHLIRRSTTGMLPQRLERTEKALAAACQNVT
jgi:hypothetical protein